MHNFLRIRRHKVSSSALPVGRTEVSFVFEPTGKGLCTVQLFVNGAPQGAPQAVVTAPVAYSTVQAGLQSGRQWGPPVAYDDYHGSFAFTGRIERVELTLPAPPPA